MASIPEKQTDIFPNSGLTNDISLGFKRAKLAWYTIDPLFFRNTSITPPNVNKIVSLDNGSSIAQQSYHYVREVLETEVFPNKDPDLGTQITNLAVLDVAYYPSDRGQYNYTVNGIDSEGKLLNPSSVKDRFDKSLNGILNG